MRNDLTPVFFGMSLGCEWTILAGLESVDVLATAVRRSKDGRVVTSGFKSPTRMAGNAVRTWVGHADGFPGFVVARAGTDVRSIIGQGQNGVEYRFELSPLIAEFGLRFGVAAFPAELYIAGISVEGSEGGYEIDLRPPRIETGDGAGWRKSD